MVGHICHLLTQTKNNVKVEEFFEDDANYPEPEDATYDKLNNFNEERKGTGTSQYQKKLKKLGLSCAKLSASYASHPAHSA